MQSMRISSQSNLLNNFSPVQPILTSNTLINSGQLTETLENIKNIPNFILGEQPGDFDKNTPLKNFPTVRPIFTNSVLIDSSQEEEKTKTSMFSKFNSGEQPGNFREKIPP
jgi:hypothetical protein